MLFVIYLYMYINKCSYPNFALHRVLLVCVEAALRGRHFHVQSGNSLLVYCIHIDSSIPFLQTH